LKQTLQGIWQIYESSYENINRDIPHPASVFEMEFTNDSLNMYSNVGLSFYEGTRYELINDTLRFSIDSTDFIYRFDKFPEGSHIIDCGLKITFKADSLTVFRQQCLEIVRTKFEIHGDSLQYAVGSRSFSKKIVFTGSDLWLSWVEGGMTCKQKLRKTSSSVMIDLFNSENDVVPGIGIHPSCFTGTKWTKIRDYEIDNKILDQDKNIAVPEWLYFSNDGSKKYHWDGYMLGYDKYPYGLRLVDYTGSELHFTCFKRLEDGSYRDITQSVYVYQRVYE